MFDCAGSVHRAVDRLQDATFPLRTRSVWTLHRAGNKVSTQWRHCLIQNSPPCWKQSEYTVTSLFNLELCTVLETKWIHSDVTVWFRTLHHAGNKVSTQWRHCLIQNSPLCWKQSEYTVTSLFDSELSTVLETKWVQSDVTVWFRTLHHAGNKVSTQSLHCLIQNSPPCWKQSEYRVTSLFDSELCTCWKQSEYTVTPLFDSELSTVLETKWVHSDVTVWFRTLHRAGNKVSTVMSLFDSELCMCWKESEYTVTSLFDSELSTVLETKWVYSDITVWFRTLHHAGNEVSTQWHHCLIQNSPPCWKQSEYTVTSLFDSELCTCWKQSEYTVTPLFDSELSTVLETKWVHSDVTVWFRTLHRAGNKVSTQWRHCLIQNSACAGKKVSTQWHHCLIQNSPPCWKQSEYTVTSLFDSELSTVLETKWVHSDITVWFRTLHPAGNKVSTQWHHCLIQNSARAGNKVSTQWRHCLIQNSPPCWKQSEYTVTSLFDSELSIVLETKWVHSDVTVWFRTLHVLERKWVHSDITVWFRTLHRAGNKVSIQWHHCLIQNSPPCWKRSEYTVTSLFDSELSTLLETKWVHSDVTVWFRTLHVLETKWVYSDVTVWFRTLHRAGNKVSTQ